MMGISWKEVFTGKSWVLGVLEQSVKKIFQKGKPGAEINLIFITLSKRGCHH